MDPRTLWLAQPDDRYQPSPALRSAERAIYPLLRTQPPAPEWRVYDRAPAARWFRKAAASGGLTSGKPSPITTGRVTT